MEAIIIEAKDLIAELKQIESVIGPDKLDIKDLRILIEGLLTKIDNLKHEILRIKDINPCPFCRSVDLVEQKLPGFESIMMCTDCWKRWEKSSGKEIV